MPSAFRASLLFLILILFVSLVLAQSQSIPNPPTLSEINDLVAALISATSEEEQERLLKRKPDLTNSSLIAALKAIDDPLVHKGDYAQALKNIGGDRS